MTIYIGPTKAESQLQPDGTMLIELTMPGRIQATILEGPMPWGTGCISPGWYFITPEDGGIQFGLDQETFAKLYQQAE